MIWNMTEEEVRVYQKQMEDKLVQEAVSSKVVTSADQAVVRDLLPATDLGDATEVWVQAGLVINTWNTTYNATLPSKKIFVVYGCKNSNATPITTAIKFGLGAGPAKVKDIWGVEPAWLELNTAGYSTEPLLYKKEEQFTFLQYANANGTDNVILLGLVCEPKGENVMQ